MVDAGREVAADGQREEDEIRGEGRRSDGVA